MKGECAMKQSDSNELNILRTSSLAHASAASRFASISMLPSVAAAFAFTGYAGVPTGAAAANTCTVISKRRTMNWAGRPLGRRGSSG